MLWRAVAFPEEGDASWGRGAGRCGEKTGSGVRACGRAGERDLQMARGWISPRASVPLYVGLVVNAAQEVKHAWALPAFRHQFLCGVFDHAEIAHRSCTAATRTGVTNSTAEIAHRICTAAAAPQPAASGKQGARLPTSAAKFQPAQAVTVRGSGQKNQTGLARSDWGPSDARARGYRLRPVCQRCCYVHSRCG
jgi:hypothetical protein